MHDGTLMVYPGTDFIREKFKDGWTNWLLGKPEGKKEEFPRAALRGAGKASKRNFSCSLPAKEASRVEIFMKILLLLMVLG